MTVLVTGANGQLGSVLLGQLLASGERVHGFASPRGPLPAGGDVERVDLTRTDDVDRAVRRLRPRLVVHAAAMSRVAAAAADPALALAVNAEATGRLAALAAEVGARFVYVSTDMVFDGEHAPYAEGAVPSPLSSYGRSKAEGERAALEHPGALVVRLPLLFGVPAAPRASTFLDQVQALREGRPLTLFHDEYRTPLSLADAAAAVWLAATSPATGVLHAGGPERISRFELGVLLAEVLGVSPGSIVRISQADLPAPEPRARDLSLDSSRFWSTLGAAPGRPLRDALARELA